MGPGSYPTRDALSPVNDPTTPPMPHELIISPSGRPALAHASSADELSQPLVTAFAQNPARGLLHLATNDLQARLATALEYVRSFACTHLTRLCQTQGHDATNDLPPTLPPSPAEL